MSDQHAEGTDGGTARTEDAGTGSFDPGAPWWADLGTWGAVALVVVGGAAAGWMFLGLPGTPDTPATGYHQVAKVVAVGLVIAGTGLLGRRRERGTARGEADTDGPERA
ncbi:hypothetical protein [Streptomyces sp. NPDC054826]